MEIIISKPFIIHFLEKMSFGLNLGLIGMGHLMETSHQQGFEPKFYLISS